MTEEEFSKLKIWKYMDLAKFLSLLATERLYFSSPARFQDLSEGSLPKSHLSAIAKRIQSSMIDPLIALRPHFAALGPNAEQQLENGIQTLIDGLQRSSRRATLRFGVSCWHISEYESEAMWKLYSSSGQGIAIVSTPEQLKASMGNWPGIQIDSVRYADFDNDAIERNYRHYGLFMKRKSFEHEKELRATVLLPQDQWQLPESKRGLAIPVSLDVLINQVYVSPLCEPFVGQAIAGLCEGKVRPLAKQVIPSQLLGFTGYPLEFDPPMDLSR